MKRKKQKWEPTLPNGTVVYCCDGLINETFKKCEQRLKIQSISYDKNKKIECYTLQGREYEILVTVRNGKIRFSDKRFFLNKEKALKSYINDCKKWLKNYLEWAEDHKEKAIEDEISAKQMQNRIKLLSQPWQR
jgi:hypothetical protein